MNRQFDISSMSEAVRQILVKLGEDPQRPGLKGTPDRVVQSLIELTSGNGFSPRDLLNDAIFPCPSSGMVLQKDLEFYSLCEHHLLPFFGHVHVAYIPDNKIIGLSKVGRIIDLFAKRLQVQENLTYEIANTIDDLLKPKGTAVWVEAQHFCMMMRGIRKQGSITQTNEYRGVFRDDLSLRHEFLQAIKK